MSLEKGKLQADKLSRIKQGGVYTICCSVDDCPCESKVTPCPRGFFSLFIQAVYGIELAKRHGIPYYVDYGNHQYLYTDPSKPDQNFWNYYFEQPKFEESQLEKTNLVRNSFYEVYPLRIWSRSHFQKINRKVVSQLIFSGSMDDLLREKREFYQSRKVLGVQIRRTDHGSEVEQVSLESLLRAIDRRVGRYEYLFVATDDNNILELLLKRYGTKLIYNDAVRSDDKEAVHSNLKIKERYELGKEVLIDCYCLSLCTYSILLQSNISYAALFFNPNLAYTLMEKGSFTLKTKRLIQSSLDGIRSRLKL